MPNGGENMKNGDESHGAESVKKNTKKNKSKVFGQESNVVKFGLCITCAGRKVYSWTKPYLYLVKIPFCFYMAGGFFLQVELVGTWIHLKDVGVFF